MFFNSTPYLPNGDPTGLWFVVAFGIPSLWWLIGCLAARQHVWGPLLVAFVLCPMSIMFGLMFQPDSWGAVCVFVFVEFVAYIVAFGACAASSAAHDSIFKG